MRTATVLLLFVLAAMPVLAQSAPAQPTGDTQAGASQKKPQSGSPLGPIASQGLAQGAVPASSLTNSELLSRSHSLYVVSQTIFVKRDDMEKHLVRRKELEEWPLHVVQNKDHADLILEIKRIPFQNNFPFTLTDRVSSIVLMSGEISSMPGGVPAKIATQIADKLTEVKAAKEQKPAAAK